MDIGLGGLSALFGVATIAGCIDAIAGGGGLIVLPALLTAGLPPAVALATNKLQGSGGTLMASTYFLRQRLLRLPDHALAVGMTFTGSVTGVWLVLQIDPTLLARVIPLLLIGMGAYFALAPQLGEVDQARRISPKLFALAIAPLLGFYDGFFGPGTGMFMALAIVSLCGHNLKTATAQAKLLNCTSNVAALLYFLGFGEINWSVGLVMLAGQFLGAYLGARLVIGQGARLIRPVVTIMCFLLAGKLLLDAATG